MKKFIISVLFVAVFFIGLGALVEKTGAKFKSDEKALALIAKARQAIGGDSAINGVQSISIVGRTTHAFKIDGALRNQEGETEIALQFPDKMMKMVKIGDGDGKGSQVVERSVNVTVVGDSKDGQVHMGRGEGRGVGIGEEPGTLKIIIKKDDGTVQELTGADAEKWIAREHPGQNGQHKVIVRKGDGDSAEFKTEGGNGVVSEENQIMLRRHGEHPEGNRQNEMLQMTLGLLLTAPAGIDVNYTYAGDGDVDGTSCDIVVAEFGGSAYRLYLSKASSLPVMMSYKGVRDPHVFTFRTASPQGGDDTKQNMVFTRRIEGSADETAEFNIKFSDYRSVGGVQFPYKWVRSGGEANETFDVTSYEINPANIAEKFQGQKVMMRMKKSDGQ